MKCLDWWDGWVQGSAKVSFTLCPPGSQILACPLFQKEPGTGHIFELRCYLSVPSDCSQQNLSMYIVASMGPGQSVECLLARKAGAGSGGETGEGDTLAWPLWLSASPNGQCGLYRLGGRVWPTGCSLLTCVVNNSDLSSSSVFLSLTV